MATPNPTYSAQEPQRMRANTPQQAQQPPRVRVNPPQQPWIKTKVNQEAFYDQQPPSGEGYYERNERDTVPLPTPQPLSSPQPLKIYGEQGEVEVSAVPPHVEAHKATGNFIKSIIYGGLDGIVSVFVTVAAVSGTQTAVLVALYIGLAKLFAGAISMGIGDWLASGAEVDVAKREKQREEWEIENYLEGEVEEMVQLYIKKGVPEPNARRIIQILSSNKKAFLDIMMAEELGIAPDTVDDKPWKHGLVNFTSFMAFGIVPLLIFILSVIVGLTGNQTFGLSIVITATTLYLMGLVQGLVTGANKIKTAMTTLGLGGITAFVGWFVTFILTYSLPGVAIPA